MRVLIVEDEPIIARRIERLTREILGERLTHLKAIHHLHEAHAHLFSTPIDVLFLNQSSLPCWLFPLLYTVRLAVRICCSRAVFRSAAVISSIIASKV